MSSVIWMACLISEEPRIFLFCLLLLQLSSVTHTQQWFAHCTVSKSIQKICSLCTALSEALIFASTNPQYDNRLFIELQVQYMKIPSSNLGRTCCVQKLFLTFRTIFVHNMFSPCSAKRRNSDKDLDVLLYLAKLDRD